MTIAFALVPSDRARTVLQFAVATICWALLLWQVVKHLPRGWPATTAAACVVTLALSSGIAHWDAVLLAESLLISAGVLLCASVLALGARLSTRWLLVFLAAGGFLVVVRPVLLPLLLVPTALLAVRHRSHRPAVVALIVVVVVASAHGLWLNGRIDRFWGTYVGLTGVNGRTVQQFAILLASPHGERLLDAALDDGAPACLAPFDDAAWEWWNARVSTCPAGIRWISERSTAWFGAQLLRDPAFALRYFRDALREQSLERQDGVASVASPVPAVVGRVFFSSPTSFDPLVVLALAVAVVGVVLATRRRWNPSGEPMAGRRHVPVDFVALAVAAYMGVLATALFSALDMSRVGAAAVNTTRVALVLVLFTVLGHLAGRTETEAGRVRVAPHP